MAGTNSKVIKQKKQGEEILKTDVKEPVPCHSRRLYTTTYSQLVYTAERRMFGLRQVLADRYDDVPGMELYKQATLMM